MANGVNSFSLMVVEPFSVGVRGQQFLNFLGVEEPGNGDFDSVDLGAAQPHELVVVHFVGDVDFDEQHGLVGDIGENHVGAAHEVAPPRLIHVGLLPPVEVQAALGIFVEGALDVHVGGAYHLGLAQRNQRPLVALGAARQHGWHHHPPLLLQNGFSLVVGVGFIAVFAVLTRCQLAYFVAEVPGLDDVAVAEPHRHPAVAAGVGFAALVGILGVDDVQGRIVRISKAGNTSHKSKKAPAKIIFATRKLSLTGQFNGQTRGWQGGKP